MTALASSVHLDHILFPFESRRFTRGACATTCIRRQASRFHSSSEPNRSRFGPPLHPVAPGQSLLSGSNATRSLSFQVPCRPVLKRGGFPSRLTHNTSDTKHNLPVQQFLDTLSCTTIRFNVFGVYAAATSATYTPNVPNNFSRICP
jgi:hypothetical protein